MKIAERVQSIDEFSSSRMIGGHYWSAFKPVEGINIHWATSFGARQRS